jgi:putative transposase
MKIKKAYKFRLEPNAEQELVLNKLLGSARFVWNQILAVSFEMLAKNERINKVNLVNKIPELRKKPECAFLEKSSNGVSLQQKVRDLGDAWAKFFDKKEQAKLKQKPFKPKKPRFFKLTDGSENRCIGYAEI